MGLFWFFFDFDWILEKKPRGWQKKLRILNFFCSPRAQTFDASIVQMSYKRATAHAQLKSLADFSTREQKYTEWKLEHRLQAVGRKEQHDEEKVKCQD